MLYSFFAYCYVCLFVWGGRSTLNSGWGDGWSPGSGLTKEAAAITKSAAATMQEAAAVMKEAAAIVKETAAIVKEAAATN